MPDFLKMGLVLMVVGAIATAILAYTDDITKEPIAAAKRLETRRALAKVLPSGFDNEPDADQVMLTDARLNKKQTPVAFYRARKGGEVLGSAFMVTAPDGYSGNIDILVGVKPDGAIHAIQVVAHAETPGLGDKIVLTDWPKAFEGKTLDNAKWAVKKDGGQFDQFAGATITPRAVVGAVKRGLEFYAANKDKILAGSSPK